MSTQSASQVDLAKLFNTVTRTLKENQESLNAADEYNHNHGDNMVDNFQAITRSMRESKGCEPSEQLARASQALSQRSQSGSAQLYAQGLSQAAEQMRGQSIITPENAMLLVNALMSGQGATQQSAEPSQPAGMDLLSSLLGGQPGAAEMPQAGMPSQNQAPGGDLLGGLLGSLLGGTPTQPTGQTQAGQMGGIDVNTLLNAGMAFFQARQQGAAPVDALVQAVMAGSQMQGTAHHSQSGQLVTQTLINTIGTMLSGRK